MVSNENLRGPIVVKILEGFSNKPARGSMVSLRLADSPPRELTVVDNGILLVLRTLDADEFPV